MQAYRVTFRVFESDWAAIPPDGRSHERLMLSAAVVHRGIEPGFIEDIRQTLLRQHRDLGWGHVEIASVVHEGYVIPLDSQRMFIRERLTP